MTDEESGEDPALPVIADADRDNRRPHCRVIEAVLFASPAPVSSVDLARRLPEGVDLRAVLDDLIADYAARGVNLIRIGDAWAFRTAEDLADSLQIEVAVPRKLSRAAVETMAIIAYHQPITRAEIEEMRGVGLSRGTLDILLEAGWIRPGRRRQTPGRPLTWGTSPAFLDHFGLENLTDLPGLDDLKAAGMLRKGQVIGGLVDAVTDHDDADDDMIDDEAPDLLEEAMIDAGLGLDSEGDDHADA